MFIRLIFFLIIAVLIGFIFFNIWYVKNISTPRRDEGRQMAKSTVNAIAKARVEYLEIRKAWINFSLQETPDYFATSMGDMTIPEVARFQKMMVLLNEKYDTLPDDTEQDVMFVSKVTALREAFDAAVLEAKKRDLS